MEGYLGNRSLDCALVTNQHLHLCVNGPLGEAAICCNQLESEGQKNIENRSTRAKSMKHKLRKRQNMIFNEKKSTLTTLVHYDKKPYDGLVRLNPSAQLGLAAAAFHPSQISG